MELLRTYMAQLNTNLFESIKQSKSYNLEKYFDELENQVNNLQKNDTPDKKFKEFLKALKDDEDHQRENTDIFVPPKKKQCKKRSVLQEQCGNGNVRITRSKQKLNVPDLKLEQSPVINNKISYQVEDDCKIKPKKLQNNLSQEQCETSNFHVTRPKLMFKVPNMPIVKLERLSDRDLKKLCNINNHCVANTLTDNVNNNLPSPKRKTVLKNKVCANVEINSPRCTRSKVQKKDTRVNQYLTLEGDSISKSESQVPAASTVTVDVTVNCVSKLEKNKKLKSQDVEMGKCEQFNLNGKGKSNKRRKISEKIFIENRHGNQRVCTLNSEKENQMIIPQYNNSSDIFSSSISKDALMSVDSQKSSEQEPANSICNREVIAVSTPLNEKNVPARDTGKAFFNAVSLFHKGCDELQLSSKNNTQDNNYDEDIINCTYLITDDESDLGEASVNTNVKQVNGIKKNGTSHRAFKSNEQAGEKVMEHTVEDNKQLKTKRPTKAQGLNQHVPVPTKLPISKQLTYNSSNLGKTNSATLQRIAQKSAHQQSLSTDRIKQQNISTNRIKQQNISTDRIKQQNVSTNRIKQQNISTNGIKQQNISTDRIKQQNVSTNRIKQQNITTNGIKLQNISEIKRLSHTQIEKKMKERKEKQNKAQLQREAIENEKKKKKMQMIQEKEERCKRLKMEIQKKHQKRAEEIERKRLEAKKRAEEEKRRREEEQKMQLKHVHHEYNLKSEKSNENIPKYVQFEAPKYNHCDSDESILKIQNIEQPEWSKDHYLQQQLEVMQLVENELEERFFCSNKTSMTNFADLFASNVCKIKRSSSSFWDVTAGY